MIYSWGITDKGVVRSQNQDAYYLERADEDLVLAIVCDGMGGAKAGNVASSLAVDTAATYLHELPREMLLQDPGEHLSQAAALANEAVYGRAMGDIECQGMGTTMVAVILSGRKACILNVGDSRAYLLGEDGVVRLTRDHSVVEDLVQRGELTPEEARSHPQKNLITRALGAEPETTADIYERELKEGEFLLLCSDGLSNMLTDQEILYEVLYGEAPEDCCQRMLKVALSRGAPDNVTAILIQLV